MSSERASLIKELEPGVIDKAMIIESCLAEAPPGEEGRLVAVDGIVLEEIVELRLEFRNILKVDHLWMLKSLVILHIGNNVIEKIENLDQLVNLKELDLSFNKIHEIENLGTLVKLEVLTIFQNKLKRLKNMEKLKNLIILSVGNNLIEAWDNVEYLRPFDKLRSLNMEGNPCAEASDFNDYVVALLPQLVYNGYRMVTPEQRRAAEARFQADWRRVKEVDDKRKREDEQEEKGAEDRVLWGQAFVQNLDGEQLFKAMFIDDKEGVAFLRMGEEVEEAFCEFRDNFVAACKQLFRYGLEKHRSREAETASFLATVGKAKSESIGRSRDVMDEFIERKTEIFFQLGRLLSAMESDEEEEEEAPAATAATAAAQEAQRGDDANAMGDILRDYLELQLPEMGSHEKRMQRICEDIRLQVAEFERLMTDTWHQLMREELQLYDQIDDLVAAFDVNIKEMRDHCLEGTRALFGKLRDIQVTYSENLTDLSNRFFTQMSLREGPFLLDPLLKPIMVDRETVANAVSITHDHHIQVIDAREDTYNKQLSDFLDDYVADFRRAEVQRNRQKVNETSYFLDIQQEELEELNIPLELTWPHTRGGLATAEGEGAEEPPPLALLEEVGEGGPLPFGVAEYGGEGFESAGDADDEMSGEGEVGEEEPGDDSDVSADEQPPTEEQNEDDD